MSVELNEVIVLGIGLLCLIPIVWTALKDNSMKPFLYAYLVLLAGLLSTVLEGFFFNSFFNALEHFGGIFFAGVAFLTLAATANNELAESDRRKESRK